MSWPIPEVKRPEMDWPVKGDRVGRGAGRWSSSIGSQTAGQLTGRSEAPDSGQYSSDILANVIGWTRQGIHNKQIESWKAKEPLCKSKQCGW